MQALGSEPEVFQLGEPDEGFQEADVHGRERCAKSCAGLILQKILP
jgi:hypothetical protein